MSDEPSSTPPSLAPSAADEGPLRVLSSMATRRWLVQSVEGWASSTGRPAALTAVGGVEAARRLREGEAWDIVVLSDDALDRLAAEGWVVAASRRVLATSPMSAALCADGPVPDLTRDDAARQALATVQRIGCSTGPSGKALQATLARWGLQGPGGPVLVQAPPGVPVGQLIEQGDVDLGFQQRSELLPFHALKRLDDLSPGLQHLSRFAGAVSARCTDRPGAEQLLAQLASAPAVALLGSIGLSAP